MFPAARKGDPTIHGGVIAEGSPNVTIGGMPAARLMDKHVCPLHGPGPVTQTSVTVYINGLGAARQTDACTCMVPSTAGGGGSADKPKQSNWKFNGDAGKEAKWDERKGEAFDKDPTNAKDKAVDKFKQDPGKSDGFKPKFAAGAQKTLFDKNNTPVDPATGKPATNYAQFGAGSAKGTAYAKAEMSDLANAKASAGAKAEVEGSLFKAQGKLGDAKTGIGEVGGEAKVLTAKADAGAGAEFATKNGKLDKAYVQAGAGAGASVVEGKVSGKTRAFKIPFTNWGVSLGGEASGALLTAEARASAYAGYADGKWSFGFGAKIGAALAGLGFKFNVTIEKLDPPKEPPKPPGVPGVAGIDPIAMGCPTVLVGGMPPPYVPGPPEKRNGGAQVDAIGIRNKAQALTLEKAKRAAVPFTPLKCSW